MKTYHEQCVAKCCVKRHFVLCSLHGSRDSIKNFSPLIECETVLCSLLIKQALLSQRGRAMLRVCQ